MLRSPVVLTIWLSLIGAAVADWSGGESPHDGRHLVVVRPEDFKQQGKPVAMLKAGEAAFGTAAQIGKPAAAVLWVAHQGKYHVWLRVASEEGKPTPLAFSLVQQGKTLLAGDLSKSRGAVGQGGPAGYAAYAKLAMKSAPGAKFDKKELAGLGDLKSPRIKAGDAASEFEQELLADLKREQGKPDTGRWIRFTRLETPKGKQPFYWWKLGAVELDQGEYELRVQPTGRAVEENPPVIDAAFLTTATALVYPFTDDIAAPPASYIRFRIERVPEAGTTISAGMRVHYDPWSSARVWLNPAGMNSAKSVPHTKPGYTPWYRLQDIERAPAFGNAEAHLLLNVQGIADKAVAGVTQFAVYPHDDYVLREIRWDEPEGTRVSLVTNFAARPEKLRTFRDHARENYDRAVAATGGRVFPLTRGDLYFSNAWGRANGDAAHYMLKTLRMLGFNCVDNSFQPVKSRELYGWTSHAGQYWPPAFLPFDEQEAKRKYAEHYRGRFDKQRELYEGVSIFQIADEPGEIQREEMSSPLWRFQKDKDGEKYVDLVGGAVLATRRTDYRDCVLEGTVEKHDNWFGFRIAADHPTKPTKYVEWQFGRVSASNEINMAVVRQGIKSPGRAASTRRGAVVGSRPTKFKIIYQGTAAALYLGDRRIQLQHNLPAQGGFAFTGPAKAIRELKFRTLRKDENLTSELPELKLTEKRGTASDLDIDELLGDKKTPEWAKAKPLAQMIREDWIVAGGKPEAQAGFRRWAAARGLKPELFGKRRWDEVRMLTVKELVETPEDARLFYWSRRYSGYLTPKMFALAADAIAANAPNPKMKGFVALSGHSLYFPSQMPLDMFDLASGSAAMLPGVSDWMSSGGWRWDSHQAVAYSVAMYNSGARRFGEQPASYPMMHCVWPSEFRAYTMLANQVRYLSYYNYGPFYQVTEGFWSESPGCYDATHRTNNRTAQVDDILANAQMRPSRVALLYARSTEYWNAQSSFADRRAAFLALAHEYYQPELVTEEQIADGALKHYDALLVMDPWVASAAQQRIADWVHGGGLLWASANAASRNEYDQPCDLLAELAELKRTLPDETRGDTPSGSKAITISPIAGQADFRSHTVHPADIPAAIDGPGFKHRAHFGDGRPAWLEKGVGRGKLVYIGHRAGLTYTSKAVRVGGYPVVWADTARALLTRPLAEAQIERELIVSEPLLVASPMSSDQGTVVVLYNMRPGTLHNVTVSLHEEKKPARVAMFVDDRLVDVPFAHKQGRVEVTLPEIQRGQMLLVRHGAEPKDERTAKMLARTKRQLASDDWQTLACGAWFAGFRPEWKLGDRLIPLLDHTRWEVRRVAAESLGRLQHRAAADALFAMLEREKDAHVLGDCLIALATMDDERMERLAVRHLSHSSPFTRLSAIKALRIRATSIETPDVDRRDEDLLGAVDRRDVALLAAQISSIDDDPRVRRIAMELATRFKPDYAVRAATVDSIDSLNQAEWLEAVVDSDTAYALLAEQGLPTDLTTLLSIAARRKDPELASAIARRAADVAKPQVGAFVRAAIRQHDRALAQGLLAARDKLDPALVGYLPLILEHTFDARLGRQLEDWESTLGGTP